MGLRFALLAATPILRFFVLWVLQASTVGSLNPTAGIRFAGLAGPWAQIPRQKFERDYVEQVSGRLFANPSGAPAVVLATRLLAKHPFNWDGAAALGGPEASDAGVGQYASDIGNAGNNASPAMPLQRHAIGRRKDAQDIAPRQQGAQDTFEHPEGALDSKLWVRNVPIGDRNDDRGSIGGTNGVSVESNRSAMALAKLPSASGVPCKHGCIRVSGRGTPCGAWLCALLLVGEILRDTSERSSDNLRTLWSGLSRGQAYAQVRSASRHPDPIGICIGFASVAFAVYSIYRAKREANRIISLFEANTQVKELEDKARRGEPLPNIVVIKGILAADGRDVSTVSPRIDGLKDRVGEIKQPKNAWIEIARQAKRDPQLKGIADAIVERTGVDAADVPDVPEPGETYARQSAVRGEGPYVLSEILVARICAKHQRVTEEKKSKKVLIKRPCRNESYNCFHGRRVADGLHLLDLDGGRADLDLPPADAVGLAGIAEPPPLFLPVNDVWTEFTHYLRRDGLSGPGGRHQRLDDLPAMRLSDPYTLLSEFIFVDVQSPGDLGGMPGNPDVLSAIADAYSGKDGPAKFLWEPRGFYDSVKNGGYNDVPAYASARFRKTEMVSAAELLERAQAAARQNALNTPFCEPTFSRDELIERRDQENCFRYTELAIPRGASVTVLARPMVAEAGTGEGAECRIRLTSPLCSSEEGKEAIDLKLDRFRFRIRSGHTVENLLRLHDLNATAYYVLAVVGFCFAGWAAAGYPGVGSR
mmetsp:Transcript_18348/g.52467  ORF Transcript_18348/g.52467 Transcript_18348/m.52467 type:complete len:760 (+) Transcript_18348:70-2349(+)